MKPGLGLDAPVVVEWGFGEVGCPVRQVWEEVGTRCMRLASGDQKVRSKLEMMCSQRAQGVTAAV